jgi:hypothetical protein
MVPPKWSLSEADYESGKIRYNVDGGIPNLIATDRSAVDEEDAILILLRTRYCNSLPLITTDQDPYFFFYVESTLDLLTLGNMFRYKLK